MHQPAFQKSRHHRRAGRNPNRLLVSLLLVCFGTSALAGETGSSMSRVMADGMEIKVFTYRPVTCTKPSVLFVLHGLNRKAEGVRNKAIDISEAACLMVFAPLFDKDRFPNWRYHRAGVVRDGIVQPQSRWTVSVLVALLSHAQRVVGNPNAKLYLFGHSAGAQFLSRIIAYTPLPAAERIVIANPSAHVVPFLREPAPYGFGGVLPAAQAETRLREYLASPITIYLGQEDTREKNLVNSPAAARQGANRLQRGRNVFHEARALAQRHNWKFGWTLVEAVGVGHSSGGMLRALALYRAIGFRPCAIADPVSGPVGPTREKVGQE